MFQLEHYALRGRSVPASQRSSILTMLSTMAPQNAAPKVSTRKPGTNSCRQLDHGGVDHQPKDAEREQGQRKGDDFEQHSQRGVDEADHQRSDQRRHRAADMKAVNEMRHNPKRQRA